MCRQVQRGGNTVLKRRGPVTAGVGTSLLPTVAISAAGCPAWQGAARGRSLGLGRIRTQHRPPVLPALP